MLNNGPRRVFGLDENMRCRDLLPRRAVSHKSVIGGLDGLFANLRRHLIRDVGFGKNTISGTLHCAGDIFIGIEAVGPARIGGEPVTIAGIAKGSGMIAPNMATMLGFIATDAAIPSDILAELLRRASATSFNAITVDSDSSTNDSVFLIASGAAAHKGVTDAGDPALDGFRAALDSVMQDLAQQIVRDGEGATKFVTISVSGADDNAAAHRIGMAIANSPLVKTAIAGEDANWGRIVMAIGKAGEGIDQSRIGVSIGGVLIAADGARVDGYDEAPVAAHMAGDNIAIEVTVGAGAGSARIWTCDLTHGYISINADYRS